MTNRKFRLIAFDLDGTLLDDEKRLPERNRQALTACAAEGIHIVPCTGRLSQGVPREILDMGVRYVIANNGGIIEDLREGRILDERFIETKTVLTIMNMAREYPGVMYDAFVDRQGISEPRFYDHLDQFGMTEGIQALVRSTRIRVPDIIDYVSQPGRKVNKVNMYFRDMAVRQLMRERMKAFPDLLVTSSVPNNLEINSTDACKGEGLLRLAARLGIAREETMGFGDNENDYSLIKEAGCGVVMENGEPLLKEIADYITAGNNDAGVALAIERLVL